MRPKTLSEFIGNKDAIEKIALKIKACKKLGKDFPHIAIFGPSGIGKSTLSEIIANELGGGYIYINSTVIKSPMMFRDQIGHAADLSVQKGSAIIMLDECHALTRKVQDNMLSLLEDPSVLCSSGLKYDKKKRKVVKDENGILKEDLPKGVSFCFATTHPGNLSDALVNRLFKIELQQYSVEELVEISKNIIKDISDNLAIIIAEASRSARDVNKICENIGDICSVENTENINEEIVKRAIKFTGYEMFGLSKTELRYIDYLGEIDVSSIANIMSYLNVSKKEVQEKIEPFLIRHGYLYKDTKGRTLTDKGYLLYEKIKEL